MKLKPELSNNNTFSTVLYGDDYLFPLTDKEQLQQIKE